MNVQHGQLAITDFSSLFMTLYWLKTYATYEGMQSAFGIYFHEFGSILLCGLQALKCVVVDEIRWPTDEQFAQYSRASSGALLQSSIGM